MPKPLGIKDCVLALAARPEGVSAADVMQAIPSARGKSVWEWFFVLLRSGRLVKIGPRWDRRYFTDQAAADAYAPSHAADIAARLAESKARRRQRDRERDRERRRANPRKPKLRPVKLTRPARPIEHKKPVDKREVVIPADVRITVCPPCRVEERYRPDPSIAGRGVITQDWRDRLQEGCR